jgi:pseudouridine-5'-phosphate glycosidase
LGYQTEHFPEFFVSKSGFVVSKKMENEKDCAEMINMQFDRINLKTGILITIPVPEEEEANGERI